MPREREQERLHLPISNIVRIMRRVLPPHAKISEEAKEAIQECASEYISFITAEANERCWTEHRKTITSDDLIQALAKLGFDDQVVALKSYLQRYREDVAERNMAHMPPFLRRTAGYQVPVVPAIRDGTGFSMGHGQECDQHMPGPSAVGVLDPMAVMNGFFCFNPSDAGSSSDATRNGS
ncbi:hypothetical protein RJ640_013446 [Escallonia rubra]|uniref:Transcription factor CBF/NF-Y/archaeal histone domain-containing protein n=1 Tax=Escallonia rubra TaxID=112253 RepID=A0AA88R8U7_9ASTE|nr:hypothetical protein RJ640_013446 [Escallonia rubra]